MGIPINCCCCCCITYIKHKIAVFSLSDILLFFPRSIDELFPEIRNDVVTGTGNANNLISTGYCKLIRLAVEVSPNAQILWSLNERL